MSFENYPGDLIEATRTINFQYHGEWPLSLSLSLSLSLEASSVTYSISLSLPSKRREECFDLVLCFVVDRNVDQAHERQHYFCPPAESDSAFAGPRAENCAREEREREGGWERESV